MSLMGPTRILSLSSVCSRIYYETVLSYVCLFDVCLIVCLFNCVSVHYPHYLQPVCLLTVGFTLFHLPACLSTWSFSQLTQGREITKQCIEGPANAIHTLVHPDNTPCHSPTSVALLKGPVGCKPLVKVDPPSHDCAKQHTLGPRLAPLPRGLSYVLRMYVCSPLTQLER